MIYCLNVYDDTIHWNRAVSPGVDRLAINPDGQLLYVPTWVRPITSMSSMSTRVRLFDSCTSQIYRTTRRDVSLCLLSAPCGRQHIGTYYPVPSESIGDPQTAVRCSRRHGSRARCSHSPLMSSSHFAPTIRKTRYARSGVARDYRRWCKCCGPRWHRAALHVVQPPGAAPAGTELSASP